MSIPPPDDEWVKVACKPNTAECCRYLTMSPGGWSCVKLSGLGKILDGRVARGEMRAVGDNCQGRGSR
jgi:hypothetical protein